MSQLPVITSRSNSKVRYLKKLGQRKYRQRDNLWLVEGPFSVTEAVKAGFTLKILALVDSAVQDHFSALAAGAEEVILVDQELMKYLSQTGSGTQVLTAVRPPDYTLEDLASGTHHLIVALDGIQDPGNAGTVARAAEALGSDGIVSGSTAADWSNPKALRASAGALFHLPFFRAPDLGRCLRDLRGRGYSLVAAHPEGGEAPEEIAWTRPTVLILGAEGQGLAPELVQLADRLVTIPHPGRVSSLNVAMAASICLYQAMRQRGAGA